MVAFCITFVWRMAAVVFTLLPISAAGMQAGGPESQFPGLTGRELADQRIPHPDDQHLDVARRPAFVAALNRARDNHGAFDYPVFETTEKLPSESVSIEEKEYVLNSLRALLTPPAAPPGLEHIDWYGLRLRDAAPGRLWKVGGWWTTSFGEMGVSEVSPQARVLTLRIRIAGDRRLKVSSDETITKGESRDAPIGVDKEALYEFLEGVLNCALDEPANFRLRGSVRTYEGVPVFLGNVSKKVAGRGLLDTPPEPTPWCTFFQLLITDSDPQYVSLTLDLREER
jgi:hypothetical protein